MRNKYLIKNVGILTLSNFSSKILVFLLVPLYTSALSLDGVGVYDLVVSTVGLLFPILTVNIVDAVMRFSMDKAKSHGEIIAIALRYTYIGWLLGGVIILIIRVTGVFPQIAGYEGLVYCYYFFYIFYHLLLQFSKGLEKVADMGIAGVISTVTMLVGNIVLLLVLKYGLKGFFIANVLSQALPALYLLFRLRFWEYWHCYKINTKLQKEMLLYCIPLIATTLGWWVNSTSDKYVVSFMVGVGANGLLSVAYKIPQIINVLQGIFIQAWQISAVKEYGGKDTALFYGRSFNFINVLMCAACAWLIILTKPLGHILYQKDFFIAWKYVPFLLVSCVFNSASGFLGPILSAKKDSKSMAMSAVYGAVTNIVLNIAFVYLIGIQGATIATIISSFVIYWVRKRAVCDEIKIIGYSSILITWLLLCLQAIIEIYTPFWWIEVVLIVLMLVLNLESVVSLIRVIKNLIKKNGGQKNESSCIDTN